jgi:transcriptional regulator with XRE-family HTH domain
MPIEPVYRKIGERIARFRAQATLTQEEAARRAGMPRPLWSKLERGRYRVQVHSLQDIALALGVEVPDIVSPPGVARSAAALVARRRR